MQEILSRNSPDRIHFQNIKSLEFLRVSRWFEYQSADLRHVTRKRDLWQQRQSSNRVIVK